MRVGGREGGMKWEKGRKRQREEVGRKEGETEGRRGDKGGTKKWREKEWREGG